MLLSEPIQVCSRLGLVSELAVQVCQQAAKDEEGWVLRDEALDWFALLCESARSRRRPQLWRWVT